MFVGRVHAQPYPSKPVKIVVAFPPGGGNDFIARFIAARLSSSLGQQFVVENRPGAGGSVGVEAGLKAPPDGYTLTLVSNSYTVNPSLYRLRYDPVADMTPIIQVSQGPYVVVVHPSLPVRTFGGAARARQARARPPQLRLVRALAASTTSPPSSSPAWRGSS